MNQIRTILISGSVPTVNQLALGDIAINTVDGKAYLKKYSGSIQSIVEMGGGTSVSASYALSASYAANGGVTQLLAGSNITLSPSNGKGQVTITSTGGSGPFYNTATGSYGSFYDTTTQTNPVGNIPRSMSFNTTDITNGVSISGSTSPFNTYIKTENPGVYNIQFSAQIDKTDSGTDEIVIWLRKNGIDLTDTATTITTIGNNAKYVAAWNWFVNSAANDYYQIIWVAADTSMRLLAESISSTHPGIPSVILTVNRVDQFLSNTGSFSGSFIGSHTGSFTGSFIGSLFGTASNALTSSFVNTLNQNVTITGNVTVSGTASINNLVVNQIGYSSGSNQLGDAANDTQTFFGTVRIPTGSLQVSGALQVSSSQPSHIIGSGNVGIGTISPGHKLDVSGSIRATSYVYADDSLVTNSIVSVGNVDLALNKTTAYSILLSTTGVERMRVGPTGNVGIGTSGPQRRLHVDSSGSATTAEPLILTSIDTNNRVGITFASSSLASGRQHRLYHRTTTPTVEWLLNANAGENAVWYLMPRDDTSYSFSILNPYNGGTVYINTGTNQPILSLGAGGLGSQHINISASGNVGINTTTATARFQVKGSGTTSGTTAFRVENSSTTPSLTVLDNGFVGIRRSNPTVALDVSGSAIISGSVTVWNSFGISFFDSSGYGGGSIFGSYGYALGEIYIRPLNSGADFIFSPNSGMSIGGFTIGGTTGSPPAYGLAVSGSVGIGTRVPITQLDVSGSGRFTGNLTVTGSIIAASFTGSLFGTSSWSVSSSRATTSSYAFNAVTSSYTLTASYVNPLTQSVSILGSTALVGATTQSNAGNNLTTFQEIVYLGASIPGGGGAPTTLISKVAGSPMSMFIEYQIIDTVSMTDQRTGTIMANFNTSGTTTSTYTEAVTADIGNTSGVVFTTNVGATYNIQATNAGVNPYTFKAILRYF